MRDWKFCLAVLTTALIAGVIAVAAFSRRTEAQQPLTPRANITDSSHVVQVNPSITLKGVPLDAIYASVVIIGRFGNKCALITERGEVTEQWTPVTQGVCSLRLDPDAADSPQPVR